MPVSPLISIRLAPDLLERVDARVRRLQAGNPGLPITRTDVLKQVLAAGLDALEAAESTEKKRRK